MLNIVTGKEKYPAAVLIRGVEGITGPGRITKALKINKLLNAKLLNKNSGLWIEDRGVKIKKEDIIKTPRTGINYAEEWKDKPYRFLLENRL
jgi:DNA-3-methyladenine glycosylase